MRQAGRRDSFETFLSGEVALVALLGAALALFLSQRTLRTPYDLPQLRLVLLSLYAVAAALLALLTAIRFGVDGRRFELLLFAGFTAVSISWVFFAVGSAVADRSENGAETWACLGGVCLGWMVIASAPSDACPTTSNPLALRSPASASRVRGWSSVMRMRAVMAPGD